MLLLRVVWEARVRAIRLLSWNCLLIDGLRVEPEKALLWVRRWCEAAVYCAGDGAALEIQLEPLRQRFEAGLRGNQLSRKAKKAKPAPRAPPPAPPAPLDGKRRRAPTKRLVLGM